MAAGVDGAGAGARMCGAAGGGIGIDTGDGTCAAAAAVIDGSSDTDAILTAAVSGFVSGVQVEPVVLVEPVEGSASAAMVHRGVIELN